MAAADPEGQAGTYVYDLGVRAGLVMRELVPELHTQGPQKCYRERATDDVTGWTIWAAATLLARLVAAHPAVFARRDVIELSGAARWRWGAESQPAHALLATGRSLRGLAGGPPQHRVRTSWPASW